MNLIDLFILFVTSIIIIIGFYQFYFLFQRKHFKKEKELSTKVDELIPFKPSWIWIYSGLYYPYIISLIFGINTFREFIYITSSFILLLFLQSLFFYFFPVVTPEHWRDYDKQMNINTKLLSFVQQLDDKSNCFPSMHVSVATLTCLHLFNIVNHQFILFFVIMFPILIGLSCLFTKQHYIIDIIFGAILGAGVYLLYLLYR